MLDFELVWSDQFGGLAARFWLAGHGARFDLFRAGGFPLSDQAPGLTSSLASKPPLQDAPVQLPVRFRVRRTFLGEGSNLLHGTFLAQTLTS